MKRSVATALAIGLFIGVCGAQEGWNIVNKTMTGTTPLASQAFVDVLPFYTAGGDFCAAINAAINSVTPPGGVGAIPVTIDARGVPLNAGISGGPPYLKCVSNPFRFMGTKAYTGRLLLGPGLIITNTQWNMPNSYFWIEGVAMSNTNAGTSPVGTVIQASMSPGITGTNFSCGNGDTGDVNSITLPGITMAGCPVVFISGNGIAAGQQYASFGTGIRNLTIDCNVVLHCIGVGSYDVQEGGGVDTVGFINQDTACVAFDSSHLAAPAISNPFLRNVNCSFTQPAMGMAPTNWIGIYIYATDGPAEISNTTVSVPNIMDSSNPQFAYCLYLDGARGTNINFFHCEHALVGEFISGNTNLAQGVSIRGLTASVTGTGVMLSNAADTIVQDIEMNSYSNVMHPYNGPLVDGTIAVGGPSNTNLAFYVTSTSKIASGTAVPTIITTDATTASQLYQLKLSPVTQATLPLSAPLGAIMYCSDCALNTHPCTGGGPGDLAVGNGSMWICR